MLVNLTRFVIHKLHGDLTYDIRLKDNKLVIVAENGIGKTTIVNIIYNTLSRQWSKLVEYYFEGITVEVNDEVIYFTREQINESLKYKKLRSRNMRSWGSTPKFSRIIDVITTRYDLNDLYKSASKMELVADEYEIPVPILYDILSDLITTKSPTLFDEEFQRIDNALKKHIKTQILYLPTYRRIERDLKNIFPDLETDIESYRRKKIYREKDSVNTYLELVEFGMDDVQMKIENKLRELYYDFSEKIRQNLIGTYLKDILNKSYEQYDLESLFNFDADILDEILARIDETIIQRSEKEKLKNFVNSEISRGQNKEDKIIAYFIKKLLDIYEEQKVAEIDINKFISLCNDYSINKNFSYSREERKIKIHLTSSTKEIQLANLSSGEKQIVSLFSHLYLSKEKGFLVIIDEPELSLSITWQEKLLSDISRAYNDGLIAVTHSPSIFKNNFINYTHSLNEFIRK